MTLELVPIGGIVRSVFKQFDGSQILADECRCRVIYDKPVKADGDAVTFTVRRSQDCPVDAHKQQFLSANPQ